MTDNPSTHQESTSESFVDPERFSKFQVNNPREAQALLRSLKDKRTLLTTRIDEGPFSFVSVVLEVLPEEGVIVLDASNDPKMISRAVESTSLTCAGRLDGVRVQFALTNVVIVKVDDLDTLRCPLPDSVLRLQRRESYRQAVPISNPVMCRIVVHQDDKETTEFDLRVIDISNDGIGIVVAPDLPSLEPGSEFKTCTLTIPDSGTVEVALKLRNVYRVQGRDGQFSIRAGCQFIDLPDRFVSLIQRYIFKVERERRLLETNG